MKVCAMATCPCIACCYGCYELVQHCQDGECDPMDFCSCCKCDIDGLLKRICKCQSDEDGPGCPAACAAAFLAFCCPICVLLANNKCCEETPEDSYWYEPKKTGCVMGAVACCLPCCCKQAVSRSWYLPQTIEGTVRANSSLDLLSRL